MASSSRRSSQASASSSQGGGTGVEVRGSPVPYRNGPLDYLPPVYCHCKMKAPQWISWSIDNPGRRYYRCNMANTLQDCSFFQWVDPPISDWTKELLLDLKSVVDKLKRERGQHLQEVEQINHSFQRQLIKKDEELIKKDEELTKKHEEVLKKDRELQEKQKELEALQVKMKAMNKGCTSFCGLSIVVVLGMLFAMLFSARTN